MRMRLVLGMLTAAGAALIAAKPPFAQSPTTIDRLYVLDSGQGVAGDISRWSPGVNVGKSMPFVDTCYLIRHGSDLLLWDTGVADAVAAMPDGLKPADPAATHWRKPTTLAAELAKIGVKPSDVTLVAVSHTHPDHIGNVELFPKAKLLVQTAEYDWPQPNNAPRFKPDHPAQKLTGDTDVFGDGSVTILSTPGHTPGHQSLMVRMAKSGTVLLSGDAVHFQSNWVNRGVPAGNTSKDQSLASMKKIAETLEANKATLWINHDKAQRDSQKMAPEYYE